MDKKLFLIFLCLTVFLVRLAPAFAQDSSEESEEVRTIVITGTKTIKNLKDSPVKTDLVTEKDIEKNHYRNLSEAILDIPGVVQGEPTGRTGTTAIMQGLGGDHILVLLDGVPLMQNNQGGFDLSQIPTTDILRIEVVKGASSALYGGQAMGGVINIITREPKKKLQYTVDILRNNYIEGKTLEDSGYNSLISQVAGKHSKTSYKLSFTNNQNDSLERDSSTVTRDTPETKNFTGGVWLKQQLHSRHHVLLDTSYYSEDNTSYVSKLMGSGSFRARENRGELQTARARLGYVGEWTDRLKANIYVFAERTDDRYSIGDDPLTVYDEQLKTSRFNHSRAEAQFDYMLNDEHVMTFGVVGDYNSLDPQTKTMITPTDAVYSSDVDGKQSTHVVESYLQDDWSRGPTEVVTGVRYTRDPFFGDNLAPKANLSFKPDVFKNTETVIRVAYGMGYRIPTLKERFYTLDHRSMNPPYIVEGNKDLQPERSHSFNLGTEWTYKEKSTASLGVFVNNVSHLVAREDISSGGPEMRFSYVNLNEVRIRGLELGATYYLLNPLRVHHSFTYTRAEDQATGLIVPQRPFYVGQTNFRYEVPRWKSEFIYTLRYFGSSYANVANTEAYQAYSTSDIRYNFHWKDSAQFYLGFLNIFNEKRDAARDDSAPFDLRPAMGTYVFVGFKSEG